MRLILSALILLVCAQLENAANVSRDRAFQRWLHGCHMMFPCPPPFCDNPIYGQGDCCGHCPEPEPTQEVRQVNKSNGTPVDETTNKLPVQVRSKELFKRWLFVTKTTTPRTTTFCPNPCTHQGVHYCHPLPCYINCVDAVRPPGGCCYICQNGPTCGYSGHVIPEGKFIIGPSGEEIHCITGAYDGGNIEIRPASTTTTTLKH